MGMGVQEEVVNPLEEENSRLAQTEISIKEGTRKDRKYREATNRKRDYRL